MIDIAILIPTRNRPDIIERCLVSLCHQKTDLRYCVYIIDQSTNSDTANLVSKLGSKTISLVSLNSTGKAAALNHALRNIKAGFYLFTDDDCVADKNWVDRMGKAIFKNKSSVVVGRVIGGEVESPSSIKTNLHDDLTEERRITAKIITPIFKMSGCNFGMSREIFDLVGFFDERFGPGSQNFGSQDNEYGYRVLRLGLDILYYPSAVIIHRSWRNLETELKKGRAYGYSAGAFLKLVSQSSLIDSLSHSTWIIFKMIKGLVYFLLKRDRFQIKYHYLYLKNFGLGFVRFRNSSSKIDNKINVFLLSPGSVVGGADKYCENIARHAPDFITPLFLVARNREYFLELNQKFVTLYAGGRNLTFSMYKVFRILNYLRRQYKEPVVITNGYHSVFSVIPFLFWNLLHGSKIKMVDISHGWVILNLKSKLMTTINIFYLLFYHKLIAVDDCVAKKIWSWNHLKNNRLILPAGVEFADKIVNQAKTGTSLLFVGRLAEEKRIDRIIKLLPYLTQDFTLNIVGSGDQEDKLKKLSQVVGVETLIKFVSYTDPENYYLQSGVLLLTSRTEGCPMVVLEAISHGLIVAATPVGALSRVLADGRGFLFDKPNNPVAMAKIVNGIMALSEIDKQEVISKSYKYVKENHEISMLAHKFFNFVN